MAEKSVEEMRDAILAKVRQAGTAGLTKAKVGSFKAGSNGAAALAELIKAGEIRNLGSVTRTRFVTAEHYRPLEIAYETIAERAEREALKAWSRAKLEQGLVGAVKAKAGEATERLIEERRLLPVKAGAGRYFLAVNQIRAWMGEAPDEVVNKDKKIDYEHRQEQEPEKKTDAVQEPALAREAEGDVTGRIVEAYRRVKARIGFSDVEICAVRDEAGVSQEAIEKALRTLSAAGRAVLSRGDYATASEAARAAAINVLGRDNMQVRIVEGGEG